MDNVESLIPNKKDLDILIRKNYKLAMEDKDFAFLCYKLGLEEKILMKYTTKLQNTVSELNNCKNCKGLCDCKNEAHGCVNYPIIINDELVFSYVPCKYKKENDKNISKVIFYETPKFLMNARMKDIYTDDKARYEILKYIKEFIEDFPNKKGVYLHGSFGSGKSYILNAVLNELSRKGYNCVSVYYPILLKKLKDSFSNKTDTYESVYNELENADVLLIDDIGAENNTMWARDEVLGSLLQSRMDNEKITFFTSNFNLNELETHLSETSSSSDKIKARRIIERIKQLTKDIELVGENRRN